MLHLRAHAGLEVFPMLFPGTLAFVADVTVMHTLLHGKEDSVFGDSGYTGADKREELQDCEAAFFIATSPENSSTPMCAFIPKYH
ncbi:transposase [Xanthomonas citri]